MEYLISSVTIYFVYSFCIFIGGSELVNLVETVFMFFFFARCLSFGERGDM